MKHYAQPFTYTIQPGRPLLVLACSETKTATAPRQLVRFHDLYSGPTWLQVRAAGYPWSNVAAISALYGFLEPGMQIETYDRLMDDKAAARHCGTGNGVALFCAATAIAGSAYVFGGALYQELARTAVRFDPAMQGRVTFARGSFLEQRAELGRFLRTHTTTTLQELLI